MRRLNKLLIPMLALLLSTTVQAAPTSVLSHFDGSPAKISDYAGKGKWLVVMIWASDCSVCNRDVGNYELFHDAHKDNNATVLGISIDGKQKEAAAKTFIARHAVKFPNLIGEPLAVTQMFTDETGVNWVGTPTFMIYNPKGKLVVQQVGAVPVQLIETFIKRNS